jgi:SH3-like domain-containing protein
MRSRSSSKTKPRKPLRTNLLLAAVLALLPGMAAALEYRSVAVPKAVLYDAPSAQGKKLFVIGQGYPLEVIVNLDAWLKVRDNRGSLSWIDAKQVAAKRTVLVTMNRAEIHQTADASSTLLGRVEKDVVLDLLEPPSVDVTGKSWVKVKHADDITGYILTSAVWGY